MRLLTEAIEWNGAETGLENDFDKQVKIFVRLIYSDWSQKQAETQIREFEFKYRAGDQGISIRPLIQPSDVRPSI